MDEDQPQRLIYQANPVVSCRVEGGEEALLYNPDTDDTILINGTGLYIWRYLEKPATEEEISAHLMQGYDDLPDPGELLQDIRQFLSDLGDDYLCTEPANDE